MRKLAILFVGIVLTLVVFLMHTRMQVREAKNEISRLNTLLEEAVQPELAADMGRIQIYMEKLWYAGAAGNVELAEFYRHEIEEVLEDLAEAGIEKDGHDISLRIEQMALPVLKTMTDESVFADVNTFEDAYLGLVGACNSCHQVTDHSFIRVSKPDQKRISNQLFTLP